MKNRGQDCAEINNTSTTAVVLNKKWGVFRTLACTAAVFAVLILMSALNAAVK